ncbi:hypothetical protein C8J57DRAFT_1166851 [Mycena rebaudengoi]|nr:hypothetical protein C8J57DRAFT_1166851 [Mycena rebaudengoi]
MDPPPTAPPGLGENGWQAVSPEWWRIPFDAVSWAYDEGAKHIKDVVAAKGSPVVAKPPHYHDALFRIRGASLPDRHSDDDLTDGDDARLNPDLAGVKAAADVVAPYEIDVGFHWSPPDLNLNLDEKPLGLTVNEARVALSKERWDELVLDLTGGLSIDDSDEESPYSHRSTSTLSSIDLTDSERSVLSVSMPGTPKARRSYANILVKNVSPSRSSSSRDSDRSGSSPSRRLNASASSFIPGKADSLKPVAFPSLNDLPLSPSPSPSPSPPFNTTFVFPSLDVPPVPAVRITKDAQGFYSGVEPAPASHTRTLLPAFLHDAFNRRRPPPSKTRAIVDRLKSAAPQQEYKSAPNVFALSTPRLSVSEYGGDAEGDSCPSCPSCPSSPALEEDGEGWIGVEEKPVVSANSKSRRTRDLFLALTRRRSNSSPPKSTLPGDVDDEQPAMEDVISITVALPSPPPSPAPSSTLTSNDGWITPAPSNDGWIEGPSLLLPKAPPAPKHTPPLPRHPHSHSHSSAHPKAAPQARSTPKKPRPRSAHPPHPAAPARYFYPHAPVPMPVPVPVPYAYMQHQLQLHQMHLRGASGEWYPYPAPVAYRPRAM